MSSESVTYWVGVLVLGSIAAIVALIAVEWIGRTFFDCKETLVAEHDPLRDDPNDSTEAYLLQLEKDWGLDFDQQEIARRQG